MKRVVSHGLPGLCLLGVTAQRGHAQSDAANAVITVNRLPRSVTVVNRAGLDFGDVLTGPASTIASSDVPASAAWLVDVEGATQVEVSFNLPSVLADAFSTSVIFVTYMSQSASIHERANPVVTFNPAVPLSSTTSIRTGRSSKSGWVRMSPTMAAAMSSSTRPRHSWVSTRPRRL